MVRRDDIDLYNDRLLEAYLNESLRGDLEEEPEQETWCVECAHLDDETMHCTKDGEVKGVNDKGCLRFKNYYKKNN